jgi:hypothetical protein
LRQFLLGKTVDGLNRSRLLFRCAKRHFAQSTTIAFNLDFFDHGISAEPNGAIHSSRTIQKHIPA